MKFGLDVPTTGEYADIRVLAELAAEAEAAGWDGFFVWDVIEGDGKPAVDPWITLAAVALNTSRMRLGTMVTPLARHRPWLVARQLANLDQLSGGRMVMTAGLGYRVEEFTRFGEVGEAAVRAERLDEGLAVVNGLWTGDSFSFDGRYYQVKEATLNPKPVQRPRVPIWLAGGWPRRRPFRRAARWDGVVIMSANKETKQWMTTAEVAECVAFIQEQRGEAAGDFDVVMSGEMADEAQEAKEKVAGLAAAGVTWWVEEGLGWSLAKFRERIRNGPLGK
jgi:alkanesulfonate monooxygenase SsuD/methylene tetrahydromethanopterin reductase-like flavin-dependent oxidoreductase (luciferase family)